ncbi:glycosyltransferase [Cryobacterium sp. Hb1]|uniref:glycosyltransferase family 2 protein n=1 Tax=Cryobacterium sp. Hb1 TaxID=1259147 RepID=UPI00141A9837|nr:glycosyltransferase [Cryobacterium sp. Hb1]
MLLSDDGGENAERFLQSAHGSDAIHVEFVIVCSKDTRCFHGDNVVVRELAVDESVAEAVNAAVDGATSDFISILRPEGVATPDALDVFSAFVEDHPRAEIIYSNEAALGPEGNLLSLNKPIFSPERLRCQFYFGDFVFYRRELFLRVGGLNKARAGALLYDLALRSTRESRAVEFIGEQLFLRESSDNGDSLLDDEALDSTRATLSEHLEATGGGVVKSVDPRGVHDTRRLVKGEPLISIIIPTRGIFSFIDGARRCFVIDAVKSIVDQSTYRNFELVLVVDSVADADVVVELVRLAGDKIRFVEWSKPFNFSDKVNLGVLHSRGEFVLLLNDDIDVISPDWLESLLALAQLPGAGMVGGMLYYSDETIQHAGHAYHEGDASHIGLDVPRGDRGPLDGYLVEREVVGVTAACAMMPRDVYFEVGGLSNLLPGNFNDVDLCMKTTWTGHDIYWTPHAELYHFESKTRDPSVHAMEVHVAWGRWSFRMNDTRYWPYALSRAPR